MSSQPLLQTAPGKSRQHLHSQQLNSSIRETIPPGSPSPHHDVGWCAIILLLLSCRCHCDLDRRFRLQRSRTIATSILSQPTPHHNHPPISTPNPANIHQASELPSQPESSLKSSSQTSALSSHGWTSPSSWAASPSVSSTSAIASVASPQPSSPSSPWAQWSTPWWHSTGARRVSVDADRAVSMIDSVLPSSPLPSSLLSLLTSSYGFGMGRWTRMVVDWIRLFCFVFFFQAVLDRGVRFSPLRPSEYYTIDYVGLFSFVHCWYRHLCLFYVFTWRMLVCFMLMRPECLSCSHARVERLSFLFILQLAFLGIELVRQAEKEWTIELDLNLIASFVYTLPWSYGQLLFTPCPSRHPWISSTKLQSFHLSLTASGTSKVCYP